LRALRLEGGWLVTAPLTLVLAQLNLWVGDVPGNVDKIVAACTRARDQLGARLIACPELALIGYPPDDLLQRSGMAAQIEAGLERLKATVRGITLIVGGPEYEGGQIYNAAWVLREGEVIARYRKQHLPNYGVFDEQRHYTAGHLPCVFEQDGHRIGVTIWVAGPAAQARGAGAQLLINLNASPFDLDKARARRRAVDSRVVETGLAIAYVNCVGGQDEVVFDGDSFALNGDGALAFSAPVFEEGLHPLQWADGRLSGDCAPALEADAVLYQALVQATRDYVDRNGFPGALIGLSGGIDSALVAAIAVDALGADRVWGVSMPSRYTAAMSNEDAREEAERLGIRYDSLPIEPAFEAFTRMLAPVFAGRAVDLTEENLQSRSRGVLLMALSNKFGHVVLTTGNKSEMAVGYATLYGDMCGGFAPIKDVYKTRVFALARWRNQRSPVIPERVLTRPPSAELRPDQRDEDSLPPYAVLDPLLEAYVEAQRSIPDLIAMGFEEASVRRIASLVRRSEYKRRQAPPGPKVTRCAFGRERRYPITAVYGDV
jgi:NAD+ synthase (glutamine-hydrolysing)